jgi:hypothetical protein
MKLLIVMAANPFNPQSGSENIAFNNIIKLAEKHSIDIISLDITGKNSSFASNNKIRLIIVKEKISKFLRILLSYIYIAPQ